MSYQVITTLPAAAMPTVLWIRIELALFTSMSTPCEKSRNKM